MFAKLKQEFEEKILGLDEAIKDEAIKILQEAIAKIDCLHDPVAAPIEAVPAESSIAPAVEADASVTETTAS